jgi:hypothetical protein
MTGINFITNEHGKRTAVVIDLKKHGRTLEDFFDVLTIQERHNEETTPLNDFINELKSEGRLKA